MGINTIKTWWNTPKGDQELETIYHGREGTASPRLALVFYKGRWITPYEQRKVGVWKSLSNMFRDAYADNLAYLVPQSSALCSIIFGKKK